MLNALGMSFDAIAALVWVPGNEFFPGQATQGATAPVTSAYSFMSASAATFTPAQILQIGAYGRAGNLPTGFNPDDLVREGQMSCVRWLKQRRDRVSPPSVTLPFLSTAPRSTWPTASPITSPWTQKWRSSPSCAPTPLSR